MSSYGDGGEFARRTISCGTTSCSAPGSPRSRVKFLCSHGGKILPRPSDGQLKYVGGETRVISVPRDISFQELMKRMTYLIDGEMILKYQLASEDLDALVTVKSEEDLQHMFDEMEHYHMMGCPRMRTFLFPLNNILIENNPTDLLPLDHRYIFTINGMACSPVSAPVKHLPTAIITKHLGLGLGSVPSSTCTSPRSPDSYAAEAFNSEHWLRTTPTHQNATLGNNMHKIKSSPSICNLNNIQQQQSNHYSHQLPHQYYQNSATHHGHSGYRSPNPPPLDTHNHRSSGLVSMRSGNRFQPDSAPNPSYYYGSRDQNRGPGYCNKCTHHDNCSHFLDTRTIDRQGTLP